MINYHVPKSPVCVGPYHQFDSLSLTSTQWTSFQGVSYQANAGGSLGLPTQGTNVHTDYSSRPIQSQADGSWSSCFFNLMTHLRLMAPWWPLLQPMCFVAVALWVKNWSHWIIMKAMYQHHQFMLMFLQQQFHTFTPIIIYSFDNQSTSLQSESLHSQEHASMQEEK